MSKEMTIIVLGIFVAITPSLGIPSGPKSILLFALGIIIALLGFLLRGETLSRGIGDSESHPFVDNTHEHPKE